MNYRQMIVGALTSLMLVSVASAEDVKTAVDADAATTLDSVLEHVVDGTARTSSKGVSSGAKGSLEIRKSAGSPPTLKGTVTVGAEGSPTFHRRTIDWNFATATGEFESVRGRAPDLERVHVTSRAGEKKQTFRAVVGQVERESVVETKVVTLKTGGTTPIIKTNEQIIVGKAATVTFAATSARAVAGWSKSVRPDGSELYTKSSTTVGGQAVTPLELDAFLKNRVASR